MKRIDISIDLPDTYQGAVHIHLHDDAKLDAIQAAISELQSSITTLGANMDANLQKVIDDLDTIKQEAGDYIAGRDAIDVTKDASIKDLTDKLAAASAQGTVDAATIKDFQDGVAVALAKAEEDKALLAPPTGVVVPLADSYADNGTFTAAVGAYTGAEAVTLDGTEVKAGTPSLDYFTQADGSISKTNPNP